MALDYRPLPAEHVESARRLLTYAFAPERGPDPELEDRERPEGFVRRGLYEVDERDRGADAATERPAPPVDALRAVCGLHDLRLRLRGSFHPVAGVSAVASPPETRRRGHVGAMLGRVHAELRDDGVPFAALWPFDYGFYRRYGYGLATRRARVTVPPGDLDAPAPEPAGEFRRCTADDWETLDAVHRAAATEPLAMRRTEGWWRHRVLESWETDPYAVAWLDDAGVPRGYLVYTVEGDAADDRTLRASDLAAADHGALRHLLRFCRDHDSQVAEVEFEARPDVATGLFELLSDPRAATVELRPGPMLRAVDVRAAVEALAVPAGVEERVTLAVDDETCPWNAGTYELRVADAAARLRPATDAEPALSVGVDALAGVLVGAVGPTRLVETGAATGDAAAAAALERAFPPAPRTPWLREFF